MIDGLWEDGWILRLLGWNMKDGVVTWWGTRMMTQHVSWHNTKRFVMTFHTTYVMTYYITYVMTYYIKYVMTYYITYVMTYYITYVMTYYITYYITYVMTYYMTYFMTYYITYVMTNYITYDMTYSVKWILYELELRLNCVCFVLYIDTRHDKLKINKK